MSCSNDCVAIEFYTILQSVVNGNIFSYLNQYAKWSSIQIHNINYVAKGWLYLSNVHHHMPVLCQKGNL